MSGLVWIAMLIIAVLAGGIWFISLSASSRDLPRCGST